MVKGWLVASWLVARLPGGEVTVIPNQLWMSNPSNLVYPTRVELFDRCITHTVSMQSEVWLNTCDHFIKLYHVTNTTLDLLC